MNLSFGLAPWLSGVIDTADRLFKLKKLLYFFEDLIEHNQAVGELLHVLPKVCEARA
jgi:hypothetical protein